jgi:hypothetical protein
VTKAPVQNHRHGPRETAIDALLRQSLCDGAGDVDAGPCLDADLLAAWADRALPDAEALSVEHHVAGCARCQAIAASLARASAPLAEPAPSLWSRWQLGWLVPVAAAAAVALWVALPDRRTGPVLESVDSRLEKPAPSSGLAEAAAPALQSTASNARPAEGANAEASRSFIAPAEQPGVVEPREQIAQPAAPSAAKASGANPGASADANADRTAADAPQEAVTIQELEASRAAREIAAPAAAPAPPPAVAQPSPTARAAAGAVAPSAAPVAPAVGGQGANQLTRARADVAGLVVAAPGSAQRWRLNGGRRIEHSLDAGASWTGVAVPSPARLTAGSSPAPNICWFVGRAGTVVVTIDGSTFTRVAAPSVTDLVTVRADDGRIAVVADADGRTFRTTDRGTTWQPLSR